MNNLRFKFIVSFFSNVLPEEIGEVIARYTIEQENSIIIRMKAIFADSFHNNFYKLYKDKDYFRFYHKCLDFANECRLTYTEFSEWFDSGLLVGLYHHNSHILVYSSPDGKKVIVNETSFIFNYYNLEKNYLQNVGFIPLCKYEYRCEDKYRYKDYIYEVKYIYEDIKIDYLNSEIPEIFIPYVLIPQISTREVYRYQRLESNFIKSKAPKASKKKNRGSRNKKMHR